MTTIKEASEKLDETMKAVANRAFKASQLCDDWPETLKLAVLDSGLGEVPSWPAAVRAYGAARELKGHVGACVMKEWFAPGPDSGAWHDCGDGWLCDKGKEIEETT